MTKRLTGFIHSLYCRHEIIRLKNKENKFSSARDDYKTAGYWCVFVVFLSKELVLEKTPQQQISEGIALNFGC